MRYREYPRITLARLALLFLVCFGVALGLHAWTMARAETTPVLVANFGGDRLELYDAGKVWKDCPFDKRAAYVWRTVNVAPELAGQRVEGCYEPVYFNGEPAVLLVFEDNTVYPVTIRTLLEASQPSPNEEV